MEMRRRQPIGSDERGRGVDLELLEVGRISGQVDIDVAPLRQEVVKGGVDVPLARGEHLVTAPELAEAIIGRIAEHQSAERELTERLRLLAVALYPVVGGNGEEQPKDLQTRPTDRQHCDKKHLATVIGVIWPRDRRI